MPTFAQAECTIEKIRYWSAPDHTRVVFDVSEEPDFKVEEREKELLICLPKVKYAPSVKPVTRLAKPGVNTVFLEQDLIRMALGEYKEIKVFKLPPIEEKPHRLVVDVYLPEREKRVPEAKGVKKRVIVIDPGHGGDDPGAIGVKGTQEKDVVLNVARKMRDYINDTQDFQAVLTRDGDYYVPFRKRMNIARVHNAALFLSIHADSEHSHLARGASVYVLSLRGASSEAARILARKENLADIIGGTIASEAMVNGESESILLNMVQTNNMNKSRHFGSTLLRTMMVCHRVKFPRVQEAPFFVLKLPEIPSVLIELGYISNRREEKMLASEKFQDRLARAIAEASISFLAGRKVIIKAKRKPEAVSSEEPEVTKDKRITKKTLPEAVSYRVAKGETWVSIAERCGIKEKELRAMNNTKRLIAGQVIKIPATGCLDRKKIIYYRVKKGDTLDKIARRHNITVDKLREINKNKRIQPLQYGEILLLPRK
ncbi:MAG TPA: N-acetylmuramoyl-L-alanine amidase [Syntrophales bacterium]|nr:N-acetylmuramoyl-L-alanine amidase [Syntrophales bacterium]HOL60232.1 N-acetylmuramoyl-L-alanine amidase [Syntrophales bacterium]HPO36339.1 N-acetylmuramoyl-L-alanine amidase [Syntrophales bacterium]